MTPFRAYLAVVLACLAGYTIVVGLEHGWNLLPVFFSNIAEMNWSGQFNLDFMTFLGLSASGWRGGIASPRVASASASSHSSAA